MNNEGHPSFLKKACCCKFCTAACGETLTASDEKRRKQKSSMDKTQYCKFLHMTSARQRVAGQMNLWDCI